MSRFFILPILALFITNCQAGSNGRDSSGAHPHSAVSRQYARNAKTRFEQKSGAIIWDVGDVPGEVDAKDSITDINIPCSISDSSTSNVTTEMLNGKGNPSDIEASAEQILNRLGLEMKDYLVNPVLTVEGHTSNPVYLLFPELHMDGADHLRSQLHQSRAIDMWAMAERMLGAQPIVNTDEGPQGYWPPTQNHRILDRNEREKFAATLMAKMWETGALLLSELFFGQIVSREHDSNDLAIKYVLTLNAYVHPDPWINARAKLIEKLPTRTAMVQIDDYQNFSDSLLRLSQSKIARLNSKICEARSHLMAQYTAELMATEHSRVSFMSFGALHTHGILEEIRSSGATAIVFSPNFERP